MVQLNSSCIKAVDYSPESRRLQVWFPKNGPYTYFDVPLTAYERLINAASPGRYFAENIKPYYSAS